MRNRHTLGLHTKREQDAALYHARAAFDLALEVENRSTLTYTIGYLQAVSDIAHEEEADDLKSKVGVLIRDLRERLERL